MARRRSIGELKRALKRRLLKADQRDIERTARELRSFAITSAFFSGYSMDSIALYNPLAKPLDRNDIEVIVRGNSARRR